MKLYIEDDTGTKHEIQRATGMQEGNVILSEKLNRKVVILDGRFRDIVTIPPCLNKSVCSKETDSPE